MAHSPNPVDWVLKDPTLLVIIFGAVAWVLQKLGFKKEKPKSASATRSDPAADQAERTRRVQAEVQRRIAEKRAARPPASAPPPPVYRQPASPVVAPRPVASPFPKPLASPFTGRLFEPPLTDVSSEADEDALEVKKMLADQERLLGEAKAAAAAARQMSANPILPAPSSTQPAEAWGSELSDPAGIRRAIVLRELLGRPVALKGFVQ